MNSRNFSKPTLLVIAGATAVGKTQYAIQTALGGYQSIHDLVGEGGRLRRQRDLAWEMITAIPGVSCVRPQGTLYMFPRLDPAVYPIQDDQQFISRLLEAERVLLVQGTGFNWVKPDHFRLVFCRTKTTCAKPLAASPVSSKAAAAKPARPEYSLFTLTID